MRNLLIYLAGVVTAPLLAWAFYSLMNKLVEDEDGDWDIYLKRK